MREGRRDPAATAAILLREYERIRALGGLYILSYHSQLLATPELVPALATVARRMSTDDAVWSTTAGGAATWWRSRANLDARLEDHGAGRLDVVVQNHGDELVLGAVAQVDLATPRRVLRASTAQLPAEPGGVRVRLPPLPAGATRVVHIAFATPTPPRVAARRSVVPRRRAPARTPGGRQGPWWAPWRW